MKKVLFATTALVASAGFAAADVSLKGSAEMGIVGGDGIETQFHTDIDVTFTMSGETDNGLTFGASVDLDEGGSGAAAHANDADDGGATMFISGDFGTLTMGDTDGGLDWALTENRIGGTIDALHEHAGSWGQADLDGVDDGQILRYDYSFDAFSFAASVELDDTGTYDPTYGFGFKYSADMGGASVGVGLGYQAVDWSPASDQDIWGVSVDAKFDNGFRAIVVFADGDFTADTGTYTGLALGYTMDNLTVSMNWGETDFDTVADTDGFSVLANYGLGGGATVQAGFGESNGVNAWSLGLAMSF